MMKTFSHDGHMITTFGWWFRTASRLGGLDLICRHYDYTYITQLTL